MKNVRTPRGGGDFFFTHTVYTHPVILYTSITRVWINIVIFVRVWMMAEPGIMEGGTRGGLAGLAPRYRDLEGSRGTEGRAPNGGLGVSPKLQPKKASDASQSRIASVKLT